MKKVFSRAYFWSNRKIVDEIIEKNENQINAYRNENEKLFGFFIELVMKASRGKANPKVVNEILQNKLWKPLNNTKEV